MKAKIFAIIFLTAIAFSFIPSFAFTQEQEEDQCIECSEPGGLVPCGRKCDDSSTGKNECLPCTLCDFFVMVDSFTDMSLQATTPVIVLLIISIIAITAYARKGAVESINKVKRALIGVVVGLMIIYAAWVIVNTVLVTLGAATWSGVNDLWVINCSEVELERSDLVRTFCGDGSIQRPNNDNFVEICDGLDLGGESCKTKGFESGDLVCNEDCSGFDETGCVEFAQPLSPLLPVPVPMNPVPLVAPPTGVRFIEGIFWVNTSTWRYDACTKTGTVMHSVGSDNHGIWIFNDDRGVAFIRIAPNATCHHDSHYCGQRFKTIECLNGYILIQPTDLGFCERGTVVFTRISETTANYSCTSYKDNNGSVWNYVCQKPN